MMVVRDNGNRRRAIMWDDNWNGNYDGKDDVKFSIYVCYRF